MAESSVEQVMQENMVWTLEVVSDMCIWEPFDIDNVAQGERAELERFWKMSVCRYLDHEKALE